MKKVYVVVASAMMIAGTTVAQIKIGAEVGLNLNNLADHYDGETTSNQIKTGFHAGVVGDFGISKHFSVSPAVRYSMKGGQEERHYNAMFGIYSANYKEKNKLSYHYLELPVNLIYKTGVEGSGRFMAGAGPFIAYMVNAQNKQKTVVEYMQNGSSVEKEVGDGGNTNLKIGSDADDQVKGLDYGGQAFIGYQLPMGMFAKAGGQVGFANTLRGGSSSFMQKNYNFFLTFGYMLGLSK